MNPTPVVTAIASQSTRMKVTSKSRYRASPAQTPAIFLLLLSSINVLAGASLAPTAVRAPHREQNRSSPFNCEPHFVQNICPPLEDTQTGRTEFPRGTVQL